MNSMTGLKNRKREIAERGRMRERERERKREKERSVIKYCMTNVYKHTNEIWPLN